MSRRRYQPPSEKSWLAAHPTPKTLIRQVPDKTCVLYASNEYLSGTATFQRKDAIWTCLECDRSISFLKSIHFNDIKNELLRRNFRWVWCPDIGRDNSSAGQSDASAGRESKTTAHEQITGLALAGQPGEGGSHRKGEPLTTAIVAYPSLQTDAQPRGHQDRFKLEPPGSLTIAAVPTASGG